MILPTSLTISDISQPSLALMPSLDPSVPRPLKDVVLKTSPTTWNSHALTSRFGADAASAASAAGLVAPVITVIDQAIVRKAATGAAISSSIFSAVKTALLRPHTFIASKPFLLVSSLYFGTYFTANSIDTLTSTFQNKKADTVSSGATKFAATSAVNMSLCVYKDSQFAKIFGKSGPSSQIPRVSYALFACRDSLTIFASFNLPSIIAPKLVKLPPQVKNKLGKMLETESGRTNVAQFITPAAMQLASTPLHLLGLDLFNRQGTLGTAARASAVMQNWLVCSFARMGRIVPAFGVGGVVNNSMRSKLMDGIEHE